MKSGNFRNFRKCSQKPNGKWEKSPLLSNKMPCSERGEISTGLIPLSHKSSAHTHTLKKNLIPVFSPPVHEQAFNLSQLGQKHADLFTCQWRPWIRTFLCLSPPYNFLSSLYVPISRCAHFDAWWRHVKAIKRNTWVGVGCTGVPQLCISVIKLKDVDCRVHMSDYLSSSSDHL